MISWTANEYYSCLLVSSNHWTKLFFYHWQSIFFLLSEIIKNVLYAWLALPLWCDVFFIVKDLQMNIFSCVFAFWHFASGKMSIKKFFRDSVEWHPRNMRWAIVYVFELKMANECPCASACICEKFYSNFISAHESPRNSHTTFELVPTEAHGNVDTKTNGCSIANHASSEYFLPGEPLCMQIPSVWCCQSTSRHKLDSPKKWRLICRRSIRITKGDRDHSIVWQRYFRIIFLSENKLSAPLRHRADSGGDSDESDLSRISFVNHQLFNRHSEKPVLRWWIAFATSTYSENS